MDPPDPAEPPPIPLTLAPWDDGIPVVWAVAGLPTARKALAPFASWFAAAPGFALLLGLNVGYCLLLRSLAKPDADELPVDLDLRAGWWGWALLLVCVQPAVVEELFFRYLLLGHLRPHFGLHGAVW